MAEQPPRAPNLDAQRAAMKKLSFLLGKWSGEARSFLRPDSPVDMINTEDAQFHLDGLVMSIEAIGRTKSDGRAVLQAFGTITYDDQSETYRMRAYNDGRFLETDLKLAEDGRGFTWGFAVGDIRTSSVLRINERGDWTELHQITVGSQPTRPLMELSVHPVQ